MVADALARLRLATRATDEALVRLEAAEADRRLVDAVEDVAVALEAVREVVAELS